MQGMDCLLGNTYLPRFICAIVILTRNLLCSFMLISWFIFIIVTDWTSIKLFLIIKNKKYI